MVNNILRGTIYFVVLVLLQVLLLNNIHFLRLAIPFLYIYFIVKIPFGTSNTWIIFLSFFLGLTIDIFSNTPGMHAAACTLAGFCRPYLIRLYNDKEVIPDMSPSYRTLGFSGFLKYTVSLVFVHHAALFLVESLSLFDPLFLILRIICSVILTTTLICIVEAFNMDSQKNAE